MGVTTDGQTTFVNAAMVTINYKPEHYPIVIDMEKKSEETVLESAPAPWALSDPRVPSSNPTREKSIVTGL